MSESKGTSAGSAKVTLDEIKAASEVLYSSADIVKTPLIPHVQTWFPSLSQDMDLYLKLENSQTTGKTYHVRQSLYWLMADLDILHISVLFVE